MTDCPYCAEEKVIYNGLCRGCITRRLARLPRPSIGVVIRGERERNGDAAAEQLKAEVAAEHARLVSLNQL